MEKPEILTVGKRGCYIVMSPNFKNGQLEATNELKKTTSVTPFGFTEHLKGIGYSYLSPDNSGLSKEQVRLKTFKDFVEKLYALAEERQSEYVLIQIKEDRDYRTYWNIEGYYQLLVLSKIPK